MNTKTKTAIGIVIIFITTAIAGAFLLRSKISNEDAINVRPISTATTGNTITSKFGFQVSMPTDWRLADLINPLIDSKIRINSKYENEISDDFSNLEEENKKFEQKHDKELANMIKTWTPRDSEMIIATKMTDEEERNLYDNPESLLSYNLEKAMNIVVKDEIANPKDMKEESGTKKVAKIFNLENGGTAFYLYAIPLQQRIIQIPITTQQTITNGKIAKGIWIETNENAISENDFIDWAKKIKINLPQ